jgi:hypothetical protein
MNNNKRAFEAELEKLVALLENARKSHPIGFTDVESQIGRVLSYLEPAGRIIRSARGDALKQAVADLANGLGPFVVEATRAWGYSIVQFCNVAPHVAGSPAPHP